MRPLVIQAFTAASCIGRGLEQTLAALIGERSGLQPCRFETVTLDTHVGEVIGVDDRRLPAELRRFDCRNNRLAELGLAARRLRRGRRERGAALRPAAHRHLHGHEHVGHPANGARLSPARSGLGRAAARLRLRGHAQLLLGGGLLAPAARARGACGGGVVRVRLERQGVRDGAAHASGGSDRRGTGGRGRLALPDDALRFSLAAAVLTGTLPSFDVGARRHLDRRGSRLRAR